MSEGTFDRFAYAELISHHKEHHETEDALRAEVARLTAERDALKADARTHAEAMQISAREKLKLRIELDKADGAGQELMEENEKLREKVKIIHQEVVMHWSDIDPKWLMEELDR